MPAVAKQATHVLTTINDIPAVRALGGRSHPQSLPVSSKSSKVGPPSAEEKTVTNEAPKVPKASRREQSRSSPSHPGSSHVPHE